MMNRGDRIRAFAHLGWIMLGGMGLCIPLGAVIGNFSGGAFAIAPLILLMAWGITASRSIWKYNDDEVVGRADAKAMEAKVSDLEERLASIEMISSYEMRSAAEGALGGPEHSESRSMISD